MTGFRSWGVGTFRRATLAALALVAVPALARAQAVVTGKVTAAGQPLVEARVMVRGTSIAAVTNSQGEYTLRAVPAGAQTVQVLRVGYRAAQATMTLAANETKTLDFAMEAAVVQLNEIVTTATGQQRRAELGNAVSNVNAAKQVESAPINNVADLMTAKVAGVTVLPGNETGSSPVVRIRGTNSLSLSNAPIYVIDGVRMISSSIGVATGGTTTSFLNDLNPQDIEDIEIVKGPSAATLYGTDAANGVIVITTKRGRAGATRWNVYGETGLVDDRNQYQNQYAVFGHDATGKTTRCVLYTIALKTCFADSTLSFNPLMDKDISPVHTGHRDQYGVGVSGGSDAVRYYVSGDLENEIGPIKMPGFARAFSDSIGLPASDDEIFPEAFQRQTMRANISAALSPKFDLNANAGWTNRNQRLPQTDNNTVSIFATALKNPGFKPNTAFCRANSAACLGYTGVGSLGEDLHGYANYMPSQTFQDKLREGVQRFTGSVDANYRPFSWMQNSATLGLDVAARTDWELCKLNQCANVGTTRQGFISDQHAVNRNFSAKVVSNSSWQAAPWAILKTTVGADYNNVESDFAASSGTQLPPGAQNVGQAAVRDGSNQMQTANKTLGLYIQEQASLRDRLFITAAVRSDQNSAFGTQFQRVFYPKLSASWLISDESFFPKYEWLNQLRLRSAYGASGVQPGPTTALQTFSAVTRAINATTPGNATGADTPALLANLLGNPNLKPETSAEFEGGFETRLFNERATFDFTYYNKKTKDALIAQPIAASAAPSALTVTRNLGSIRNSGVEAMLNVTLVDKKDYGWDVTLNGSHNTNKILSLGVDQSGKPNPTIGTGTTRDSLGMPANGWFFKPYTYSDKNNDGLIDDSEVTVGANDVYMGYSQPRDIFSVQNGIELFGRKLRLSTLFDYKGGFSVYNQTMQFYCSNQPTCYEETNLSTPLWRQARVIAQRYASTKTNIGYLENGQFWRWREASAALALPNSLASRLRARDASLVFTARNLHLWTGYTGVDPESNYSTGDVQTDFETVAPPTYFTFRLNLHF